MTNDDVAVATPTDETNEERPDRSLAEQLVEQARADGKNLVCPGGLLSDLIKQVLETGLEVEMEEHLGYAKHAAEGRNHGNSRNGTRSKKEVCFFGVSAGSDWADATTAELIEGTDSGEFFLRPDGGGACQHCRCGGHDLDR